MVMGKLVTGKLVGLVDGLVGTWLIGRYLVDWFNGQLVGVQMAGKLGRGLVMGKLVGLIGGLVGTWLIDSIASWLVCEWLARCRCWVTMGRRILVALDALRNKLLASVSHVCDGHLRVPESGARQ